MKHLSYLVLGVLIVILTSATTVSVMTVKPATPKSVMVFGNDLKSDVIENIKQYARKGYIVKFVAGTSQYGSHWIVVMEKY